MQNIKSFVSPSFNAFLNSKYLLVSKAHSNLLYIGAHMKIKHFCP
jgi:hypothetical protein